VQGFTPINAGEYAKDGILLYMHSTLFIFGAHPALSCAELRKVIPEPLRLLSVETALVQSQNPPDAVALQTRLGGTIKIAHIIESFPAAELEKKLTTSNMLAKYFAQSTEKIIFGFSCYGKMPSTVINRVRKIGFTIKKGLQQDEFSARFLFDPSGHLPTATVAKSNMMQRGAEIIIVGTEDGTVYTATTETVQDFESYSHRDYGRPVRDTKSGTLPPKLAQIMINFAQAPTHAVLLDPFCGSGTVLQEAIQLGYANVVGSDISSKAIADSRTNLEWYLKAYENSPARELPRLIQQDIRSLPAILGELSVDTIVTESYLGPSRSRFTSAAVLQKTVEELTKLYRDTFSAFAKILRPAGTVVIALPFFLHGGHETRFDIMTLVSTKVFTLEQLLDASDANKLLGVDRPQYSLEYARSDQRVGRQIFILKKKG